MATVYPEAGKERETAQRLLALAEHPHDVRTTTDTAEGTGSIAFIVPDDLADAYVSQNPDGEPAKPRRRGRPPKNQNQETGN